MTNGMSGADISSLLYVKSNTFKIERKKKKREMKKKKPKKTKTKKDSPPATLLY